MSMGTSGGGAYDPEYQSYVALLSQEGSASPSATVLQNTLGGTVVWARAGEGLYTATLVNGFPVSKIFVSITPDAGHLSLVFIQYTFQPPSVINLRTSDAAQNLTDDLMMETSIEIRVYP